jgi:hypothetical protein
MTESVVSGSWMDGSEIGSMLVITVRLDSLLIDSGVVRRPIVYDLVIVQYM